MLEPGIVESLVITYASSVVIIPKKVKTIRFCVNCRKFNQVTQFDSESNSQIDDIIDRIGEQSTWIRYTTHKVVEKSVWTMRLERKARS